MSRRRALGMLAVALIASAAGLVLRASKEPQWLERNTVDARFSLRDRHQAPPGVVVLSIDNNTLAHLPRFPFSRKFYARVLQNLHAAGSRLVVFDVAFDRPTTHAADLSLFEAAAHSRPVVFGTPLVNSRGDTEVLGGNSNLASIGAQAAATEFVTEGDGVIRHLLDQVNGLPSIAAAVGKIVLGHPVRENVMRDGWIDFRGPPGSARRLSFLKALHGDFDPSIVRGKVVVIGATAPGLQDLHTTSVGGLMPGPELQAQAISTVLSRFPLRNAGALIGILSIILLAVVVPLAGLRVGALASGLSGIVLFCIFSLASQLTFNDGVVLNFSDPAVSLLIGSTGTVIVTAWSERRERRRLRELFAADATAVVEQVLKHPGQGLLSASAIIAGYSIEQAIGRGGMGVVYRATQTELDRTVAIKLIATERAADHIYRERFKQESRLAASIDHANVIPVYEAGEDDGLLFIAMRLVEGSDLAQLIGYTGALPAGRALGILEQLAGALDAAHARGLVHRDVKPANVLLTADEPEHVYLTDFGVAKNIDGASTQTSADQLVGTLDYIAPEQIRGDPLSGSVDLYGLTGLFYYCLTGKVPFPREEESAKLWAHLNAPPPAPSDHVSALPKQVDAVVARGMQKDPALRYQTASEIARAAAHALGLVSRLSTPKAAALAKLEDNNPAGATIVSQ